MSTSRMVAIERSTVDGPPLQPDVASEGSGAMPSPLQNELSTGHNNFRYSSTVAFAL